MSKLQDMTVLQAMEPLDVDLEHDDDLDVLAASEAGDLVSELRRRTCSFSEADQDYDSVSSPGGSSTASGPTYIRPAGFDHHAQEILAPTSTTASSSSSTSSSTASMRVVSVASTTSSSSSSTFSRSSSVLSRHSIVSDASADAGAASGGTGVPSGHPKGAKKKKGLLSADFSQAGAAAAGATKKIEGVPVSRAKGRKEPLPMKQRALPQSFWQQPNVANPQPPGIICSALPPLPLGGDVETCGNDVMTPVEEVDVMGSAHVANQQQPAPGNSPSGESTSNPSPNQPSKRVISAANTDLLFSLFNAVEEEETQRRIHVVRRGRPKKSLPSHKSHTTTSSRGALRDDDPCLNSAATESILPFIPERLPGPGAAGTANGAAAGATSTAPKGGSQGTQVIKIMSISHGDRSVELPSLNVEHNYPHLLSELVMKL